MLSVSLKPATVADGATIVIAGAVAARTIIAVTGIMIAVTGIMTAATGIMIAATGIVTTVIATGMVITDKNWIVLNPAPAGFFFSNNLIIHRCEDGLSSWREGRGVGSRAGAKRTRPETRPGTPNNFPRARAGCETE